MWWEEREGSTSCHLTQQKGCKIRPEDFAFPPSEELIDKRYSGTYFSSPPVEVQHLPPLLLGVKLRLIEEKVKEFGRARQLLPLRSLTEFESLLVSQKLIVREEGSSSLEPLKLRYMEHGLLDGRGGQDRDERGCEES
jgi:hypothetical protein